MRYAQAMTTTPDRHRQGTTTISQRQLRNDSGDVLRRAAAGEVFRIRSGTTTVELRRAATDHLEALTAAGLLSPGNDDDFADFEMPAPRTEGAPSLEEILDADRADR